MYSKRWSEVKRPVFLRQSILSIIKCRCIFIDRSSFVYVAKKLFSNFSIDRHIENTRKRLLQTQRN